MTLEYQIDSLEGLDDSTAALYIEKEGKYYLDVAGHDKNDQNKIPKSRLDQEIAKGVPFSEGLCNWATHKAEREIS